MIKNSPYIPFYISDFLSGTGGMTAATKGVYITLICLIYEAEEPITQNWKALARRCGCTLPAFKSAVGELIEDKKITLVGDAIWSEKCEKHIERRRERSATARGNVKRRWGKSQQNQRADDTNVIQTQYYPEPEPESSISSDEDIVISHPSELSQAIDVFNEAAVSVGWQKCQTVTAARSKSLKARLREVGGIDGWRLAIRKAVSSDFLAGRNGKWHGFSFDWIIKQSNFTKLMEGNYGNRSSNNGCNQPRRNGDGSATVEAFAEVARRRAQGCS